MNICQNSGTSLVAESSTSKHDSVAGYAREDKSVRASDFSKEILGIKKNVEQVRLGSLTGQEKRGKILPKKDVLRQLHKASLEDSARTLQAMNKDLDFKLTKHGKVQLAELASMVRVLNKEMETVEAVELDVSREPLWDTVEEGSSLRGLLESLKLKLETILNQKPELKDEEEHAIKVLKRGCEFEAFLVQAAKGGEPCEGVTEASSAIEEKNTADLPRTTSRRASFHEAEQLTLAAEEFDNEKAGQISTSNQMTTMSQVDADPNKLTEIEVAAAMSQVDADPKESSFPNFSIRNFVSTARNNNIKANWPFSRRSLKLCLKHTIKNLLPPFQSLDSVQSNFTEQCLAETVLPAQGSLDEKPIWLKNHPVSSSCCNGFDQKHELRCTDSNSSPSGIQDLASKVTAFSQSEIESVSTSKIPLSEVSDKQGSDVPSVKQKKKGASISIPNKKRRMVVKLGANMDHGTAEDITSTYTVHPEAVAQNTCPVCGIFSSSSNTTLNAHIDQCLLVEPTECMKSSKTVKARPKPRKIRLMSDICATAPCSTLEDLDIRNGRVIVAGADLASRAKKLSQGKIERESLRHVKDIGEKIEKESSRHVKNTGEDCGRVSVAAAHLVSHANKLSDGTIEKESLRHESNSGEQTEKESLRHVMVTGEKIEKDCLRHVKDIADDNAVYFDASGTKIRILSKTKDALSIPKCTKEMKVKRLKKGKRGKFLSSKKKLLAKNLKFSQAYVAKVCVLGKSTYTGGTKQQDKDLTPVFKIQEERKVIDSGNCFERAILSENNHGKSKRGRPKCKVQTASDLFVDSEQSCFSNSNVCKDIKKSRTVKVRIASEPNSIDRNTPSCMSVVDGKDQFPPQRKSMNSTPLVDGVYSEGIKLDTGANLFTRKKSCMPEAIHSSPDNGREIHADGTIENRLFSHANENPPTGFHDPKEVTDLPTLGNSACPSGKFSTATSTYSRVEKSCVRSGDEAAVPLTSELGGHFNSMEADGGHHNDKNELTDSVSSAKLPMGKVVASFSRSSDHELRRLTATYSSESSLLQFAGSFLVAEPSIHASQPVLGDMCETFYTTEGGNDICGHGSEEIEQENYLPPVESIPIPGPPGSYLPSFRDSGFEYLQSCHDAPDIDKFNSEFPKSTESTISGITVAHPDLGASEKVPHVVAEKGPSDGRTSSPAGNAIMSIVITSDEAEMLTSDVEGSEGDIVHQGNEQSILKDSCQPYCCSRKERMTWDAALIFQESTVLRRRMMAATLEADLGSHLCSNLNTEVSNFEARTGKSSHSSYGKGGCENVLYGSSLSPFGSGLTKDFRGTVRKSSCPSGCDSAVLSPPPVFRLMGKDLMVLNNDEHSTAKSQPSQNDSVSTKLH